MQIEGFENLDSEEKVCVFWSMWFTVWSTFLLVCDSQIRIFRDYTDNLKVIKYFTVETYINHGNYEFKALPNLETTVSNISRILKGIKSKFFKKRSSIFSKQQYWHHGLIGHLVYKKELWQLIVLFSSDTTLNLSKVTLKTFRLQKISIFNKYCSFELSDHQNPEKKGIMFPQKYSSEQLFLTLIIKRLFSWTPNHHIRMISEDCWLHFIIDILIFEVTAFWLNEQSESSLKDILVKVSY